MRVGQLELLIVTAIVVMLFCWRLPGLWSALEQGLKATQGQAPSQPQEPIAGDLMRRGLAIIASGALTFIFGLSLLRLSQAIQNGSDETILRGWIACGVFGALLGVAIWSAFRRT